MFDWNDQELSNIIWGEDVKSDDHIVPYLEGSEEKPQVSFGDHKKKQWKHDAAIIKAEQGVGEKTDFYSQFDANEGLSALGSADATERNKDYVALQNQDQEKDETDLLDCGWANIGTFDDFDRILSDGNPMFGHANLGNADELWLSSKDVINSPENSFPMSVDTLTWGLGSLSNASEQRESKMEFQQVENQSFTQCYGRMSSETAHGLPGEHPIANPVQYGGGQSKNGVKEKITTQKTALKCEKRARESNEDKLFQGYSSTLSPVGSQFQPLEQPTMGTCSPFVLDRHRQFQVPEYSQNHRIPNQLFSPRDNFKNQCSAISTSPCLQFGGDKNPAILSGCEVGPVYTNPFIESLDTTVRPPPMTPKEKVEKLRRRQQMQALLAIRKQQERFNHEISSTDPSITQNCPLEYPIPHAEETGIEIEKNLSLPPIFDPYFSEEQDDSNITSLAADEYSVEETMFHRLQNITERLDIRIRICIRDSLFRLAQSAMQRHYVSDTSSTNRSSWQEHEAVTKQEINSRTRYSRMPEMETETNPIDRVVAHLLFQRRSHLSGKHIGAPTLPICSMLPHGCTSPGLPNSSMGTLPESSKNNQICSQQGSKAYQGVAQLQKVDQFGRSSTVDASQTASNNDPNVRTMEIKGFIEERQTAE